MHLSLMGDWVAWNPDMTPQATETNIIGQIGVFLGCRFERVISGMVYPCRMIPLATPSAMMTAAILMIS